MKYYLILVLSISTVFSTLSQNTLDREKAAELLIKHFEYPNLEFINLRSNFYCLGLTKDNQACVDYGLIYKSNSYFSSNQNCWNYEYKPTSRNEKYLLISKKSNLENTREISRYITAIRKFEKVTGIRFNGDKTEATVEFSIVRYKVTPFGKALGNSNGIVNYKVKFALYDDGWRIITKTYNYNYTFEKYPFL